MAKGEKKKTSGASAAAISDSRFASFETNPRYRLPSKSRVKTKIDKRFQRVFEDKDFTASAKLDRYGRKLKSDNKKKALLDIYEPEVENDDVVEKELEKADAYDPARQGGFSSSESESESESDDESDEDEEQDQEDGGAEVAQSASMQRIHDEQAEVETGDITRRIAVVNLDWDNIKAVDLMALFTSFVPQGGRVEKVSIYPSEFGKERMKREEVEGPPKEIFKAAKDKEEDSWEGLDDSSDDSDDDESEDDEEEIKNEIIQEGDDQDFDNDALRSYQLDRLRYFYAVVVCSDTTTAKKLYDSCDGTEYLASSNFVDMRFIPDDVTFDDEPREECDSVVPNYQPTEFVTDALQHSKVKLTWDVHPDEAARKEGMRKAFSGSRADLEENDFRAYLASDSEDDDGESEVEVVDAEAAPAAEDQPKLSKKELKARKLREALGLGAEPMTRSSRDIGPVGDMQVTFTAALMGDDKKKNKKDEKEETTVEKYIRKERERKAAKKEKSLAKRKAASGEADQAAEEGAGEPEEDLGFDDPFFTTDEPAKVSKSAERKEERRRRREEREAVEAENAAQKAQLEKIMAADHRDQVEHLDHFNMDEIAKAEKKKAKKIKGKKGKKDVEDHGGLQEGFEMDVEDDRFRAVFESHEFAIDPSNPKYKATPGMKKLLEEGRKKRKNKSGDFEAPPEETGGKAKKQKIKGANDDISSLVESIRQKAQAKGSLF
ncbi:hypothetical protein F5Y17DRAFT_306402 [Xylariaceae sp. FL0594]|nr:hypothetical protein F5Y17DRAFT_306402 [Xylariaceae sp. FL0594]